MKQNKHRTLKLALLFSVIIFSIMTLSMLLIGVIIVMLYYTGHLGELDTLFLLIWFIFPSLITGIVIAFLVAIKGLQPVLKMCDAITKVAEGDFSVRFKEKYLIYEVSQMAECFNVMVKELDNMNTVHTNFINNVSHEFRTPLSAIEGYAALLGNEQINKAERIQYANQIIGVTEKLSVIINNILLLSKISVENMKIEKEYFNLSESIREVLIMLENKWSVKKLSIDLELQDFLYLGSKEMMEEVWNNLIGNAIKFSDSGGQLKIKSLKNKNTVIVIISDNGIGMTKETQEKIYDKFFQADTSHSQDGAGLGLSIVKRIIAVHQGKIHIDSELNKGTTFTIDLPMLKKQLYNFNIGNKYYSLQSSSDSPQPLLLSLTVHTSTHRPDQ